MSVSKNLYSLRRPRYLKRRDFLRNSFLGLGLVYTGGMLWGCSDSNGRGSRSSAGLRNIAALRAEPDANGLLLPEGFSSRVIARANQPVAGTTFLWHTDPDGGATFAQPDGGWIYVSNREFIPGGVDAIRFDANGEIVNAYNILPGLLTQLNCAGGITPWGTWFSCEEHDLGVVWECDPGGAELPQRLPALGNYAHEAAAVDPQTNTVYLTEDEGDGRWYRFIPDTPNPGGRPNLTAGKLQAAQVLVSQETLDAPGMQGPWPVVWKDVPNPNPLIIPELPVQIDTPTRQQLPETTAFHGGEGIWYHEGGLFFTTKSDNRVWHYDIATQLIDIVYDDNLFAEPVLQGVDNVVVTPGGDIVVSEDGGDMQVVAVSPDGSVFPLVQVLGQDASEVTGPAFSPDGQHLYFSSQRGTAGQPGMDGITYAVTGPFFDP